MPTKTDVAPFAIFLGLSFAAMAIGAQFEPGAWYAALRKPAGTPPGWVFALVWPLLYACIGVSAALVWRRGRPRLPLAVWGLQLTLNAAWSWLFFGLHAPGIAYLEIRLLWFSVAALVILFWQVRPLAGALLLPYLLWLGFAAYLNAGIWKLNP